MLVSRISLVVLGLTALAAALPAQIKALDDLTPVDRTATTMVPMRYTDVKANGEVAELFGTLPEIKAQLKWINGTLQIPFDVTPARRKVAVASIASLGRRGKGKDNGRVVCGTTGSIDNGWFGHPPEFVLEDGIKHLDHLRGNCGTGGGPGVCSRVSCSYNIGIILCNEKKEPVDIKCVAVAESVKDIMAKCGDDWSGRYFKGMGEGWNVLVKKEEC